MGKLFIAAIFALFLNGCVALDIVDIFTDDTPIHYAEVQSVTKSRDKTMIIFVDGYGYEINNHVYVSPGDKVKVFKEDDGSFSAKVD